jgi:hypothetical protein
MRFRLRIVQFGSSQPERRGKQRMGTNQRTDKSFKEKSYQGKSMSITERLCGRRGKSEIEDYDFNIEIERFGGDINAGK